MASEHSRQGWRLAFMHSPCPPPGHTLYEWCSLNKNDPHRLLYLNAWFPVSGTVWEGIGDVESLEEMCCWGVALRCHKPTPSPVSVILLAYNLWVWGEFSATSPASCPPVFCHASWCDDQGLTSLRSNAFSYKLPWSWCFITVREQYPRYAQIHTRQRPPTSHCCRHLRECWMRQTLRCSTAVPWCKLPGMLLAGVVHLSPLWRPSELQRAISFKIMSPLDSIHLQCHFNEGYKDSLN